MTMQTMLNPVIAAYIEDSNAANTEAQIAHFKNDAVVLDEGGTHRGTEEIRGWAEKTHAEYHFKLEPLDVAEENGESVVTCQVSGTFPGSPIQLHFRLKLDGDKIASLRIID